MTSGPARRVVVRRHDRGGDPSTGGERGEQDVPRDRYGHLVERLAAGSLAAVLLDDGSVTVVDGHRVEPLTVEAVRLLLDDGADLLRDPALRRGLVDLWSAEVAAAGVDTPAVHRMGDGKVVSGGTYALAEVVHDGRSMVLAARVVAGTGLGGSPAQVLVVAERPNRWD